MCTGKTWKVGLVTIGGRCSKVSVSSPTTRAVLDQEVRAVQARSGRVCTRVEGGVRLEVLTPAGADEDRVALLQYDVLALCRLLEVRRRDLKGCGQRARVALNQGGDVEKNASVHQQIHRKLVDREVGADAARADAVGVARRSCGIESAEELSVPAYMPDRVDARRAVLAAEMLHLGGERKLPAVAECTARAGVRRDERERIERIHRCDWRGDLPVMGEVDQARSFERAQKRLNLPRVVVGKRRRKLSQAKCGEGAREQRAGGTGHAESWLGHGSPPFKVYVGRDVE